MTSQKTAEAPIRLDAGVSRGDVVVGSHWASGFETRRHLPQIRLRALRKWLDDNEARARQVAARIGEPGVVLDGYDPRDSAAELVDVIHLRESLAGSAVRDTLVFRGWGSRNIYRPDMAGRQFSYDFDNNVAVRVFDHRFLEAYDDGKEPMFVSYPYVLEPGYRPFLKKIIDMGWHISLSPYGNHLRNGSLRLAFTEYDECSDHIADLNAKRFEIESDVNGQDKTPAVTRHGDVYRVVVDAPSLFGAVFEGIVADDGWVLVCSDEGADPLRPSIHIDFRERAKATSFVRDHLEGGGR
jgi:hypothetical protein